MAVEERTIDALASAASPAPAAPGMSLLELRQVSKRFGPQLALDRVDLDLRAGEVHALVGHNGSGKSTLVKILSGFHEPDGGSARMAGSAFSLGDAQAARAAGLRFVHQDLALVGSLSVTDNVMLGDSFPARPVRGIDWSGAHEEVGRLLRESGYDVDPRARVDDLKPVDRTGVAIVRALRGSVETGILVLDEPTAALPSDAVETLCEALRRLRVRGLGILYISHQLEEVFALADRVTVLRDGRTVATRQVGELDEDALVELIVGRAVDLHRKGGDEGGADRRTVLEVRGLAAGALRGLDLEVGEGEIVGVAGVAGSGRDDLAPALFGAVPRHGTVSLEGTEIAAGRPDRAIAAGLGMVGADRGRTGLVGHFSVAQNLSLPRIDGRLGGWFLSRRQEERESLDWLDLVELKPRVPSKRVSELSGGNQQKVLLGRWLRALPHLLIIDQPTEGVDVGTVGQIYDVIRGCAARGTAFVVCSSDTDELIAICDRILVLNGGVLAAELTGAEIDREVVDHLSLASRNQLGGSVR